MAIPTADLRPRLDLSTIKPSSKDGFKQGSVGYPAKHPRRLRNGPWIGGADAWRALDERLARTKIGRLLQERHEIAEQILDAEEDDEDGEF